MYELRLANENGLAHPNAVSTLDASKRTFYIRLSTCRVGLKATTPVQLSGDGPRESLATFIEWVLVSCESQLTVDIADSNTSPTQDPDPSPPSPRGTEHKPEPTDDGEPCPAAIPESERSPAAERRIASDMKPNTSDQVREPVTVPTTREQAVDCVSAERSSAPCIMAEGERTMEGIQGQNEEERPRNPLFSPGKAPAQELSPVPAPQKYHLESSALSSS
ncbi:putative uncharacterized protein DDB_G0290521 [Sinocyclocheilus anshuiensis]|uniref:putative uncharacterized protein DDB_G0290521 n=1 Tax=Sinocyclocheilus anshuiensis TaxID=1608454 RepID=UPI0007B8BE55|nr:PREDICTED: putative uncharacterized protein DDB_G0290521 [Sinocyclocheilus anshuiensis]